MLRSILTIAAILLLSILSIAQTDSTDYMIDDSTYMEDRPNYIGFNLSPLVTGIVGDYNKDVKFTLIYKRNIGYKNVRVSFNHLRTVHPYPYNSYKVISTTDTSYYARFNTHNYKSYDVRIGVEELRGYRHARLHIGADVILGYASYGENYFDKNVALDSAGVYRLEDNDFNTPTGYTDGNYFDFGVDVSFGFDWFLSDDFLFTFQITPQFNYNFKLDGTKNDDLNVLPEPRSFADFKLTYFDVMLVYKF